jgi:uncharacterized membrane protein
MNIVYFLGRLHVVVLHLPIGIVLVTLAVELLSRREKFRALHSLTPVLWVAAAITAVTTAGLGLLHEQEGIGGASVGMHRAYGLAFAATVVCAAVLRSWRADVYRAVQLPVVAVLVVLVTLTGHYGGNITHGSAYLAEYAPEPLRALAGLETRRPPVTELSRADVYLDVVQPILKEHCAGCHNDDRLKGGLSLSNHKKLMAGGRSGAVIAAGDHEASDLYRRITLPADHEDFMPAEGKPPLSENDKRVIAWWITAGAPAGMSVADVGQPPDDVRTAMLEVVGLSRGDSATEGEQAPSAAAAADIEKLAGLGFDIRPVASADPMLEVAFAKGQTVDESALASLLTIRDQVAQLNLRSAGLKDAHLRIVGQLPNLQSLRIELNDVTDEGVRSLRNLGALRSLNLHGTQVTDASLETLAAMRSLQDVYLWNTKVSEAAILKSKGANGKLALHAR